LEQIFVSSFFQSPGGDPTVTQNENAGFRPCLETIDRIEVLEAAIGIEPMNKGFADLCLTTWLRRPNAGTKIKAEG
jgi:hypothetical protein